MGGGYVFDKYKEKLSFNSPEFNRPKDNYQYVNQNNNKLDKTNNIVNNILENSTKRKTINKRMSEIQSFENRNLEKNYLKKNSTNKINNNYEMDKNYNSNFFNGKKIFSKLSSKQKSNEIIEEEENNSINDNLYDYNNNKKLNKTNNINNINENRNKQDATIKKRKDNREIIKKLNTTNINYNLGENNFIFININKGSLLLNNNKLPNVNSSDNLQSTTPKMIIEKENLEEISKGNKKLFSHFIKKETVLENKIDNNKLLKDVLIHSFDMNKYNEEMLNLINYIRMNPKSFIKDIDYIINNNINKNEEGIFLLTELEEKVKLLDNYMEMVENTKNILIKMSNSFELLSKLKKIKYNEDLEIILDESAYEEVENEYPEVDIKDIPSKLNIIYVENDTDENIDTNFDDDNDNGNDINLSKFNENINIIDFDNESENKEKNKKNENDYNKNIQINNNENISEKKILFKPKVKLRRKHNFNSILDLNDDKIANLILEKRKEIKSQYPKNNFKISVIKDIRISILVQILMEEFFKDNNIKTLMEIIFDPQYTNFGVSWANEVNRNFICIYCFA